MQKPEENIMDGDETDCELHGSLTIYSLPYELHEMIVIQSARLLTRELMKTYARPLVQVYWTLSTVCKYFHCVVTSKQLVKRKLKQHLIVLCRPYKPQAQLLKRLRRINERVAVAVTAFNDKLYVICNDHNAVDVYINHDPYIKLPSIVVKGLKDPQSIITCDEHRCVYISDQGSKCIWRIKESNVVQRWKHVGSVGNISMTPQGNVMALIAKKVETLGFGIGYNWTCKVCVFGCPGGSEKSTFDLPQEVVNPNDVVLTRSGSLIVCHGGLVCGTNRVLEISQPGNTVVSKYGEAAEERLIPLKVSLIDNEERMLVVDSQPFGKSRILLLDRSLRLLRVVLTLSKGFAQYGAPWNFYYDRHSGQLMVLFRMGQIAIYRLRR